MKLGSVFSRIKDKFHASARMGAALTAVFIAAVVVVNVVIYGLSSRFGWYFATGETYEHTIGDATDGYLAEVADKGEVTILFCDARDSLEADSVFNLVWQTALQFSQKYDFISVENVNIYTNPERVEPYKYQREADGSYTIDPDTGKRVKINTISTQSVIFVSDTDYAALTMESFFVLDSDRLITAYNGEEVTAAMIHRVLSEDRPVAYFTTTHGETFSSAFNNRLLFAGYTAAEIDLWQTTPEVGAGNLLVISNPRYDFDRGDSSRGVIGELDRIEAFLGAGGSVYVMLDPLVTGTVQLEALLSDWGITVMREKTDASERDTVMIRDRTDAVTTDGYGLITAFGDSAAARQIATEMDAAGAGRVIIRQASPLVLSDAAGKTVSSLLVSSDSSAAYAGGKAVDSAGRYTVAAISQDDASGGGIFAVGSVYFTSQSAITTNEYGNKDLVFLSFRHLSGASVPVGCTYLLFSSGTLEDLTMWEARLWTVLFAGVLPLAAAVTGIIIIRKRRER